MNIHLDCLWRWGEPWKAQRQHALNVEESGSITGTSSQKDHVAVAHDETLPELNKPINDIYSSSNFSISMRKGKNVVLFGIEKS